MKYLSILSKILVIVILISCNSNKDSLENNKIQNQLDDLVIENNLPGLNFSIIYENGEQENYSSGYADTIKKTNLNAQHVLFSGSVGKTYAVAVLMQLLEEGKVDLNDNFIAYFPENEWLQQMPNIQDITIEMLLQHTSGLPRYIYAQAVWDSLQTNPDKVWSYYDRLSYTFTMDPVHAPGEGWSYSDTNYLLIGMLIEKITEAQYYLEVQTRILGPGELNETHPAIKREIPNLPVAYSNLDDFFRMPGIVVVDGKYIFNPQMEWTGGGIASTTPDLAKWAKLYYEHELFSAESLQKIITPIPQGLETGPNESYGMGSFILETEQGKAYSHTGFIPGFQSIFAYFPEKKIAVAMQSNCD